MPTRRNDKLMTPERRRERWEECAEYLRRYGNLPAARAAAKKDGKNQNVSVWLSALGKMLEGKL